MPVYSYLDVSPFHLQFDRTQPSLNSFHHANNLPLYYSTDPAEIKFCLDHGLDPNFIHKDKKTIFRLILDGFHWNGIYDECLDETVAMLLYYGGNPAIESRTDNCSELFGPYSAFDFVSLQMYDQVSNFVFQELFMHTMNDDSKCGKLRLQTFLHLVYKQKFLEKSQDRNHVKIFLVDRLINYDLEFVINDNKDHSFLLICLMGMDFERFKTVVRRHPEAVRAALESQEVPNCIFRSFSVFQERMEYLLSTNDFYFNCVIEFFERVDGRSICESGDSELEATTFVLFMVEYGMKCDMDMCHIVYRRFGDCILFRTLLHLDIELDTNKYKSLLTYQTVMVVYLVNITLSVEDIAALISEKSAVGQYTIWDVPRLNLSPSWFYQWIPYDVLRLLDFCVNPKLRTAILTIENLPKVVAKKIDVLPRVPSLVELARDASRKHIVERFEVKTAKEFYSIVNGLPIGESNKKIIKFETPLYHMYVPSDEEGNDMVDNRYNLLSPPSSGDYNINSDSDSDRIEELLYDMYVPTDSEDVESDDESESENFEEDMLRFS